MHRHSPSYFETVKYCFLKLKFIPKHHCQDCKPAICKYYENAKNTNSFYKWKEKYNLDKLNTFHENIKDFKRK